MTAAREPPRPPSLSLNGNAVTPRSASEHHRCALQAEALGNESSAAFRAPESRTKRLSASSNIACSSLDAKLRKVTSSRLSLENGDCADARGPVDMRVTHARIA